VIPKPPMIDATPTVLRNRGVPVTVACIAQDDDGRWQVQYVDDVIVTEVRWLRIDMNVLADINERWTNLDAFGEALKADPVVTLRDFLALVWEWEPRRAGTAMLADTAHLSEYLTAIDAALAMANGVDPTVGRRMIEVGWAAVERMIVDETAKVEAALTALDLAAAETTSSGRSTPGGAARAVPSTSSGTARPRKSSSPSTPSSPNRNRK
jgi:hypothetical protein